MITIVFYNYGLINGSLFNCLDFFLTTRYFNKDCKLVIKNLDKNKLLKISSYKYINEVLKFYDEIEEYDLNKIQNYDNFLIFDFNTLKNILLINKNIIYVNNSVGDIDDDLFRRLRFIYKNKVSVFNEMSFFDKYNHNYIEDYRDYVCKIGLLIYNKNELITKNTHEYNLVTCICDKKLDFEKRYIDILPKDSNEYKLNSMFYKENLLERINKLYVFRSLNIDRKPNLPIECAYLNIPVFYFDNSNNNYDGSYYRTKDAIENNLEKYFITKKDLVYDYFD